MKFSGIQIKIFVFSFALFVLFAAAFVFGDFFQVKKFVKEDYYKAVAERVALMELSFFEESDFVKEAKLQALVEKFAARFPEILRANIYGRKGENYVVLASTVKEKIGSPADSEDIMPIISGEKEIAEGPDSTVEFLVPVRFGGKPVLSAGVYISSALLSQKIWEARLWNGAILSLGFFSFLIFSLFFTNLFVVRPVGRFIKELGEISEKGDLSRRVIYDKKDEFGYLAGAVNKFIAQLSVLDDLKYNFLKSVSHQLRTPLGAMRWGLEVIAAGKFGKLNKEQEDFFHLLLESNDSLLRIVDNMILASNLEEGSVVLNKAPLSLEDVLRYVIIEMELPMKLKKVKLEVDIEKMPPLDFDKEKISEVFRNLLSNAVYYNKEGGEIKIKAALSGNEELVSVRDSGIGIPESEKGKLFMKFYRGKDAYSATPSASGLGLFISKKIVELHGGKMRFKSKLGEGSEFSFSLPVGKNSKF